MAWLSPSAPPNAPAFAPVPHRQYVFTVSRLLRSTFARRRVWLGELFRIAARLLDEARRAVLPWARPASIEFVRTFGDLMNFHPHVHVDFGEDQAMGGNGGRGKLMEWE